MLAFLSFSLLKSDDLFKDPYFLALRRTLYLINLRKQCNITVGRTQTPLCLTAGFLQRHGTGRRASVNPATVPLPGV